MSGQGRETASGIALLQGTVGRAWDLQHGAVTALAAGWLLVFWLVWLVWFSHHDVPLLYPGLLCDEDRVKTEVQCRSSTVNMSLMAVSRPWYVDLGSGRACGHFECVLKS